MIVTANYSNGNAVEVTDYSYEPSDALAPEDTLITVSYTDSGITHTATVTIEVSGSSAPALNADGYHELYTPNDLLWFADQVNTGVNASATDADGNNVYVSNSARTDTASFIMPAKAVVVSANLSYKRHRHRHRLRLRSGDEYGRRRA